MCSWVRLLSNFFQKFPWRIFIFIPLVTFCTDSQFSPFIILTPTPPHSHLSYSELNERRLLHLKLTHVISRGARVHAPRTLWWVMLPVSPNRSSRPTSAPHPPPTTRPGSQGRGLWAPSSAPRGPRGLGEHTTSYFRVGCGKS